MAIYITGDIHGNISRFSTNGTFRKLTENDFLIICGDCGLVWGDTHQEKENRKWLSAQKWTTLFVDGNHENFDLLSKFPVEDWNGGKVQKIEPKLIHLMRGQVFELEGKTFFTMGGAASHDISDGILDPNEPNFQRKYYAMSRYGAMFRVLGVSWWKEEVPSDDERAEAIRNLEKHNNKVDYVITHEGPSDAVMRMCKFKEQNEYSSWLQEISDKLEFVQWYFGHHHENSMLGDKYTVVYDYVLPLYKGEKQLGKFV